MDAYEEDVVVLINELDNLLHGTAHVCAEQTGEPSHAVVGMHNIIAHFNLP